MILKKNKSKYNTKKYYTNKIFFSCHKIEALDQSITSNNGKSQSSDKTIGMHPIFKASKNLKTFLHIPLNKKKYLKEPSRRPRGIKQNVES